ncbi:MAG: hypothetical protein RLZZ306_2771 [Bacteroidota bacterium]|jgi:hypothetical protein
MFKSDYVLTELLNSQLNQLRVYYALQGNQEKCLEIIDAQKPENFLSGRDRKIELLAHYQPEFDLCLNQ